MNHAPVDRWGRREFLLAMAAAAITTVRSKYTSADPQTASASADSVEVLLEQGHGLSLVAPGTLENILPIIGTGGHAHTYPGATTPLGLVQLSPDTSGRNHPMYKWYGWDHDGGYHYPDDIIKGFSHTHTSGTGGPQLGDVLVMPGVGDVQWVPGQPGHGFSSFFSHQQEISRPGFYSVFLQTPGVKAELTASMHCGMHRYTFSRSGPAHIMVDLTDGIGRPAYQTRLNVEDSRTCSGYRWIHAGAESRWVYFVMKFSRPFERIDLQADGTLLAPGAAFAKATGVRAAAHYQVRAGQEMLIKVGISSTSIEGARKNLVAQMPGFDFDTVHQDATEAWSRALTPIDASISDRNHRQAFYTGMYHVMVAPNTFNDVDGTYRGEDGENHRYSGFTKYTPLSIWDIFRCAFPLQLMMHPPMAGNMMNTFLADYRQLNAAILPIWEMWGNNDMGMTGFHAVSMVMAAYTRGLRDWDAAAMYTAMKATSMNERIPYMGEFRKYGFVSTGAGIRSGEEGMAGRRAGKQAVSRTLDYAYDCWCVGAFAELLNKPDDAAYYYKLAGNYRNVFDPKTGFMRGKYRDGRWREPFNPSTEYWYDYTESDAWQATFNVMHDIPGLIQLYGGDAPFIAKLDALFTASSTCYNAPPDISGMVGQDAQGNEPSNHIPYLYPFAGAAWKTQYWVRQVALRTYNNKPDGIPGNDDFGQLSAWYVMTALGFYPVNPANGVYVIGSPMVDRAVIKNSSMNAPFTIITRNNSVNNCYIARVTLNGKTLERSWISHDEITRGGEMIFDMSAQPNKSWATAIENRPPSGLMPTSRPG